MWSSPLPPVYGVPLFRRYCRETLEEAGIAASAAPYAIAALPVHQPGLGWGIGFSIIALLSSCATSDGHAPSLLDPRGPAADHVTLLIWILFIIAGAVCGIVLLFLLWALFKRHGEERRPFNENRAILIAGVVIPAVILFAVFGLSLATTSFLSTPTTAPRLTVNVVAHQWWWEVQYPE